MRRTLRRILLERSDDGQTPVGREIAALHCSGIHRHFTRSRNTVGEDDRTSFALHAQVTRDGAILRCVDRELGCAAGRPKDDVTRRLDFSLREGVAALTGCSAFAGIELHETARRLSFKARAAHARVARHLPLQDAARRMEGDLRFVLRLCLVAHRDSARKGNAARCRADPNGVVRRHEDVAREGDLARSVDLSRRSAAHCRAVGERKVLRRELHVLAGNLNAFLDMQILLHRN